MAWSLSLLATLVAMLPTHVKLATIWMEIWPECVRIMETGVGLLQLVIVSIITWIYFIVFMILFLNTVAVDCCGSLDDPTNGAVNTSSGTTFMMNATYTCNTGYNLNGTNTRTCQATGDWSGSDPTCDSTLSSLLVYTVLIASSCLQLSPVHLSLTLIMEWSTYLTTTLEPLLTTPVTLATCWLEM